MSLPIFYRGNLPDLWIGIRASHRLRVDGGPAVQDGAGVPGQVTLRHVSTGALRAVLMAVWGTEGMSLGGKTPFRALPMGEYAIEGTSFDQEGLSDDFSFGFVLAFGSAPENGAVDLGGDSSSSATLQAGMSLSFGAPQRSLTFGSPGNPVPISFKP